MNRVRRIAWICKQKVPRVAPYAKIDNAPGLQDRLPLRRIATT